MDYADRISVVRKSGLRINFLRKGHVAVDCKAPLRCKKCPKKHHTLLHRDADSVPQEKPKTDDKVEENHVAALTMSEQVLLITCKVNVTANDGSSTVARAVIDPASSASYVHE